jgi:hypothetical protein
MNTRILLVLLVGTVGVVAQRLPEDYNQERAERDGRALTADLLSRIPAEHYTNTGILRIGRRSSAVEVPIRFTVQPGGARWVSGYEAFPAETSAGLTTLTVLHESGQPSRYFRGEPGIGDPTLPLTAEEVATLPFAGSDFWVGDLGLDFLHWPVQRLLKRELKRGQSCHVLESSRTNVPDGGYARVVSWLDIDTGGVVLAKAYNADRRRMKEFVPKRFKKVDGEWHLLEMRIENVISGSETTILFDVGGK